MPSIRTTPLPDEPEEFVGQGEWWVPGQEVRRVRGTVQYDEADGIRLELAGEFVMDDDHIPVLFGLAIGRGLITLTDVHNVSSHVTYGESGHRLTVTTWRPQRMLVGAHLSDGERAVWGAVAIGMSHLHNWAPARSDHADVEVVGDSGVARRHTLTIDIPTPVSVLLPHGVLVLHWLERTTHGRNNSVTATPSFHFTPSKPMSLDVLWESVVRPLILFMNFVTDETNFLSFLKVVNEAEDDVTSCDVFGWAWADRRPGLLNQHWTYPVQLQDVRDVLPEMLVKWFETYAVTSTAMVQHAAPAYNKSMYLEETFTRSVRALESWHRANFGGMEIPESEYKSMLIAIKTVLPKAQWELASMRLRHGNELTLAKRLASVIELAGSPVTDLLDRYSGGRKKFIRTVVNARNTDTHALGMVDTDDDVDVMAWAVDTLRFVFLALLARSLSLTEEQVGQALVRREKWRSLDSDFNVYMRPARD